MEGKVWRDWSLLPVDIINNICELFPIPYRFRLCLVCKSWLSAISSISIPPPWLLLPGDSPRWGEYTHSFPFYSITTNTNFTSLVTKELCGWHCVGSQQGSLVMCDLYLNICVINPMSGDRVDLPSFSSDPNFKFEYTTTPDGSSVLTGFRDPKLFPEVEASELQYFDMNLSYIKKIVICKYGPALDNIIVLALFGEGKLAYLRADDTTWHGLDFGVPIVEDITYFLKSLWALTANGEVILLHFHEGRWGKVKMPLLSSPMLKTNKFIVFDRTGVLYLILRRGDFELRDGKRKFVTIGLTVMKLNPWASEKKGLLNASWVPAEDLGGRCLFVGSNNGICLSAEDSPHGRGNCVYLTSVPSKDGVYDMGVYDMEKRRFESIYPQDMELNWTQPPGIWFKPCLN